MSKIVRMRSMRDVDRDDGYTYGHLATQFNTKYSGNNIDKVLLDSYGLRCYDDYDYEIVDESKFALFMLKYSQFIKNII